MLSTVRNLSKSTVGTIGLVLFLVLILAAFALSDLSNIRQNGFGLGGSTLAKAGSREVTDRDLQTEIDQTLAGIRQQNPAATLQDLEGQFDNILAQMINARALSEFADDGSFGLSKALVDAEIAKVPAARGLDGRVTTESYNAFLQAQRMTDKQFRAQIETLLYARLLIDPATGEVRVPTGFSTPYADSLMEERSARFGAVPASAYAGKVDRSAAALNRYYEANKARYTIPERRVLQIATIPEGRFDNVVASSEEIDEVMAQGGGDLGSREERVLSMAVLPDEAVANRVASAARSGSFVDAVAPAGFSAQDVSIGPQNRGDFASLTSSDVANAVFAKSVETGAVVGPVRSPLGWHVVKIEAINNVDVRSEAEIRGEVAEALTAEKRLVELQELASKVQDELSAGASFTQIAADNNLAITETPPITAAGRSRGDENYTLPENLQSLLGSAFALQSGDRPQLEPVDEGRSFAVLALGNVIAAAPPPLADIREQVEAQMVAAESSKLSAAAAQKVLAKMKGGANLASAIAAVASEDGVSLPGVESQSLRRLQLSQMGQNVPPFVEMMFRIKKGEARLADSGDGSATYIVLVDRITPGRAAGQIGLVDSVGAEFKGPLSAELTQQFLTAIVKDVGVTRNDDAVATARQQIFQNR